MRCLTILLLLTAWVYATAFLSCTRQVFSESKENVNNPLKGHLAQNCNDSPLSSTNLSLKATPKRHSATSASQSTDLVIHSKELFASRGHDFSQLLGSEIHRSVCPLAAKDIQLLLSKYTRAQRTGRYEAANAVLFELKINGVQVNIERKLWRADGKSTWDEHDRIPRGELMPALYKESLTNVEPIDGAQDRVRVAHLLQQRANAVLQEDLLLAHYISLELWKTYGVVIDDAKRTWSFQNENYESEYVFSLVQSPVEKKNPLVPPLLFSHGKGRKIDGYSYRLSIHSLDLPNDEGTVKRIDNLIHERAHKRAESKFREADAIRTELWRTYYVGVNDRLRQWSVGGVFDDAASSGVDGVSWVDFQN